MNDIADRVARGAAWLDEKYPAWFEGMDLSTLDLGNCTRCVLGQVYTGVIPAAEQGQVLAQAIALVTAGYDDALEYAQEYREEVASGQFGGYQILTDFHELPEDGVLHGFVARSDGMEGDLVEYAALLDEWTRVIISRRMARVPADLRELVSIV
jgi:hypothetical protein